MIVMVRSFAERTDIYRQYS